MILILLKIIIKITIILNKWTQKQHIKRNNIRCNQAEPTDMIILIIQYIKINNLIDVGY